VTQSGQRAAIAAAGDTDFVARSRQHNARQRARFAERMAALGNHGICPVPSEANFVLVLFGGDLSADTALQGLANRGYAVRHLPSQGLGHALRITIGTAEDMDAIAEAIGEMADA